jgi:SNF2 family DNA or RNA helicase
MLSVVEEASGKIIIWANYRHDIEAIKLALQKEYGMNSVATYYGDTEAGDRQQIVTSFQDPEHDLRFFVGNPRTGGYGLTLTAANVVIYYSNSFDLEVRLQSEDRAHRIGQTKSVTYVDLMSPKTVDEKIVKALRDKINIADQVMGVEDLRAWLI